METRNRVRKTKLIPFEQFACYFCNVFLLVIRKNYDDIRLDLFTSLCWHPAVTYKSTGVDVSYKTLFLFFYSPRKEKLFLFFVFRKTNDLFYPPSPSFRTPVLSFQLKKSLRDPTRTNMHSTTILGFFPLFEMLLN